MSMFPSQVLFIEDKSEKVKLAQTIKGIWALCMGPKGPINFPYSASNIFLTSSFSKKNMQTTKISNPLVKNGVTLYKEQIGKLKKMH